MVDSLGNALTPGQEELDCFANQASSTNITEELLLEKTRQELIDKSKSGADYSSSNQQRGRNRWERRKYSQVANSVRDYNSIDMDAFWKGDILEFGIRVRGETDDYVVTVLFEGILAELRREVAGNHNKLEFKCVLRALLKVFNTGDVYISCSCLHPDTRIKLLDGTVPTVREMCERFDRGERLYTYSTDENGDFKPGEVERVWVTKTAREFIKVTLDNGKEILTTPEHPYMLRDGSYMLAGDLEVGQSLMPSPFSIAKVERVILDDTPVYDIKVKEWGNFVTDAGVVLHNCPDWKYRMAYFATKNRYNSGTPEVRPSDITNPGDTKGAGCKHSLLVISNLDWMMKVASVINNYVKWCRQNMERNYAQYIFPQVYGVPYNRAVQMSLFDDPNDNGLLPSDQGTIGKAIERGMQGKDARGRWTPGNPYRFSKSETQDAGEDNPNQLHLDLGFGDGKAKSPAPEGTPAGGTEEDGE